MPPLSTSDMSMDAESQPKRAVSGLDLLQDIAIYLRVDPPSDVAQSLLQSVQLPEGATAAQGSWDSNYATFLAVAAYLEVLHTALITNCSAWPELEKLMELFYILDTTPRDSLAPASEQERAERWQTFLMIRNFLPTQAQLIARSRSRSNTAQRSSSISSTSTSAS